MKLYNSNVRVLKLQDIPETGDMMFSLANPSYTRILSNGEIQIDYTGFSPDLSHAPTEKAAIGVDKEGTTILVEVESPGVTLKQLANVLLELDAYHAVYTDIAVIKTYELLELEKENPNKIAYEGDRSAPIARPTTTVKVTADEPKKKSKK